MTGNRVNGMREPDIGTGRPANCRNETEGAYMDAEEKKENLLEQSVEEIVVPYGNTKSPGFRSEKAFHIVGTTEEADAGGSDEEIVIPRGNTKSPGYRSEGAFRVKKDSTSDIAAAEAAVKPIPRGLEGPGFRRKDNKNES